MRPQTTIMIFLDLLLFGDSAFIIYYSVTFCGTSDKIVLGCQTSALSSIHLIEKQEN